jgi:hypothetical protein
VLFEPGPERARCEDELDGAGHPLPLPHRAAWAEAHRPAGSWFVGMRDPGGRCVGGFAVEVSPTRALPGHLLLRAERFGGNLSPEARDAGLRTLAEAAQANPRVLRVNVELLARPAEVRSGLEAALARHGFEPEPDRRRYAQTAVVDLTPPEAKLFEGLDKKTRQHIRRTARKGVEVRPIMDVALAGRVEELLRESLGRHGGQYQPRNWAARIGLSQRCPAWSRLVGLFRTDVSGAASLLAFAWGQHHGDHAHYDAAGATRANDLKVPLAHALVWDLMGWAKGHGARWLDLGGITEGTFGDGQDHLGGISDFKRGFSTAVVEVGGEWVLRPHWLRARLASAVSTGAAFVSRFCSEVS